MPTDHPDGTYPVAMIMADIMMPVDIQAQYVTLGVDIQAQTIDTLAIDIKAQTLSQLNVNIAASAITMNVAVTGTANISINAQTVGVYLQPEWAALQGQGSHLYTSDTNKSRAVGIFINYTVPPGKTLYINGFSGAAFAYLDADADKNQICLGQLMVAGKIRAVVGGNAGFAVSFPTPIVATEEQVVHAYIYNMSNHNLNLEVSLTGYEI